VPDVPTASLVPRLWSIVADWLFPSCVLYVADPLAKAAVAEMPKAIALTVVSNIFCMIELPIPGLVAL
jgi:hypothetical protein